MYHKLGSRPPRTRLRGLYVSRRLFAQQMKDLADAGFATPPVEPSLAGSSSGAARRITLTFDDGFANVLPHGLGPLRDAGLSAIQYLVADRLGRTNDWEISQGEAPERLMDAAEVREWMAAGHEIGAHTCTHPWLTRIPVVEAREEIRVSRARLEDLFGRPVRHFAYPFGDWNPAVRDLVAEAGFETAVTTAPGVNLPSDDPLTWKRFTARHASLKWGQIGWWLRSHL
jgi:peptidoglycan/xylan/chitin deacetylase (PgdA/CDA1 family)